MGVRWLMRLASTATFTEAMERLFVSGPFWIPGRRSVFHSGNFEQLKAVCTARVESNLSIPNVCKLLLRFSNALEVLTWWYEQPGNHDERFDSYEIFQCLMDVTDDDPIDAQAFEFILSK